MSTSVLPAAASLTTATATALDMSYSQDRATATSGKVLVAVLGLAVAGAVQLGAQAGNLKVAKQDAFDSILALTREVGHSQHPAP